VGAAVSDERQRTVFGKVTDDLGNPVGNARVYMTDAPGPMPDVAALTDGDGNFGLPAPVAGDYTIECNTEGRAAARVTVSVGRGEPATADIALKRE
jgi:phosphatidate phosphatase APP1